MVGAAGGVVQRPPALPPYPHPRFVHTHAQNMMYRRHTPPRPSVLLLSTQVMLRALTARGLVECRGVVTDLAPALMRAQLARGARSMIHRHPGRGQGKVGGGFAGGLWARGRWTWSSERVAVGCGLLAVGC